MLRNAIILKFVKYYKYWWIWSPNKRSYIASSFHPGRKMSHVLFFHFGHGQACVWFRHVHAIWALCTGNLQRKIGLHIYKHHLWTRQRTQAASKNDLLCCLNGLSCLVLSHPDWAVVGREKSSEEQSINVRRIPALWKSLAMLAYRVSKSKCLHGVGGEITLQQPQNSLDELVGMSKKLQGSMSR